MPEISVVPIILYHPENIANANNYLHFITLLLYKSFYESVVVC